MPRISRDGRQPTSLRSLAAVGPPGMASLAHRPATGASPWSKMCSLPIKALLVVLFTAFPAAAAPGVGAVQLAPTSIAAGVQTPVRVTAVISDPTVLPSSVNLQRLNDAGAPVAVLGSLRDDGVHGDAVAGDQIYTLDFVVNETAPMRLRVSAGFRGMLRRLFSAEMLLQINSPPSVSLTGPAVGASHLAPATITLTATAADTDGTIAKVEFFHGTTLIGTATAAPYRVLWNGVPAGSYSLTATATDNQGAATGSDARAVTVNATNTPPTVSLIAPADGAAYVLPVTVTLSATASGIEDNTPITRVDFHHGSTLIGGSTTAPYTTTWAPPTAGAYHLTAVATDSAGGVTTSAARTITVQGANQLPNVSLTSPLANQSFTAPANIALAAIASDADGTIARVEFFQGSTLIGSATAAPYGAAWNNVPAGSYILTARATDDRGATRSSSAIPITVTGGGPSILYLHGDHLGTPRVATNEANVVVWRNPPTTEPFGMAQPEEDPDADGRPTVINLRFPGQYFDRETLLHYNYFRDHYFPDLGRYGQSDPIGLAGGINTYAYVGGNPIMGIDPTGLLCVCAYTKALDANAKDNSQGQCAKYVRTALEAGGADTRNRPVSAKDYGGLLERNGFAEVPSAGYAPRTGDTAVFDSYAGGSPHGHVQGYTGNGASGWVSDFRQPRFWASRGYEGANSFKVYRPTDTGSTVGGGCSC